MSTQANTVGYPSRTQASAVASKWSGHWFTVVRVVLGLILLAAAGLKLCGMNVTAVPRVGWFATPRVQVAAAEWELVLGLWLLSGAYRTGAWLAAVGTFLAFAGVSGYFGWLGVASCGCLGVIKASPWLMFGVDLAALGLLAVSRPGFRFSPLRLPSGAAVIPVRVAAVLVVLTGVGSWLYGSPQAALARLRGDALTASADFLYLGSGSAGQELEAAIEVRNWTDRPVRLVGGTSDCSCVTTSDLPLTILPGEARPVTVRLRVPAAKPGALTRVAELWTDLDQQRNVRFRVGCLVEE
jgi:hypothetical protein